MRPFSLDSDGRPRTDGATVRSRRGAHRAAGVALTERERKRDAATAAAIVGSPAAAREPSRSATRVAAAWP